MAGLLVRTSCQDIWCSLVQHHCHLRLYLNPVHRTWVLQTVATCRASTCQAPHLCKQCGDHDPQCCHESISKQQQRGIISCFLLPWLVPAPACSRLHSLLGGHVGPNLLGVGASAASTALLPLVTDTRLRLTGRTTQKYASAVTYLDSCVVAGAAAHRLNDRGIRSGETVR